MQLEKSNFFSSKVTIKNIVRFLSVPMVGILIYSLLTGKLGFFGIRATHIMFCLVILFLIESAKEKRTISKWLDFLLLILAVLAFGYVLLKQKEFAQRLLYVDPVTKFDVFYAISAVFLVLEGTRRKVGWHMSALSLAFLIYSVAGPYIPGYLRHRGIVLSVFVENMYLSNEGIFGIPLGVAATMVFAFVLFGSILIETGARDFFTDLAMSITG